MVVAALPDRNKKEMLIQRKILVMTSESTTSPQQLLKLAQDDPHLSVEEQKFSDQPQPFSLITITANKEASETKKLPRSCQGQVRLVKTQSEVAIALRLSPVFEEHEPWSIGSVSTDKGAQSSLEVKEQGVRAAMETIRKGKSIEVVRVERPHGDTVEVSHLREVKKWIFRLGKQILVVSSKEELIELQKVQSPFRNLCAVWNNLLQTENSQDGIRTLLSGHTLCGKLTADSKQIIWHALVRNSLQQSYSEDPFDAKSLIDKHTKLNFVKIKSLGILKNEDQISRVVQNAAQSVAGCQCQMNNGKYGNSRIFFVQSDNQDVVGGCDLLTLEDMIFKVMQKEILSQKNPNDCIAQLRVKFEELIKQYGQQPPYPFYYYEQLMSNMIGLSLSDKLQSQEIKQKWFKLIKLCLYLESKRLSVSHYAAQFIKSNDLMSQVDSIPMETFGPLHCNITIIYCFITLQSQVHRKLAQELRLKYQDIGISFTELEPEIEGHCVIDIKEIVNRITSEKKEEKIRHFFISETPRVYQINSLLRQLQKSSGERDYFKICLVTEKSDTHAFIHDNEYPVSLPVIFQTYEEAYLKVKNAHRLQQKAKQLKKVTQNLEALRNYELEMCSNKIEIEIEIDQVPKAIESVIEGLLASESSDTKIYYPLMMKFDKLKPVEKNWELKDACQTIMRSCLFKPPTVISSE